jgi:S-adenosylmethionine/arginine decarboxylase-like enzyme
MTWGYHLQLDCGVCEPSAIRDAVLIYKFSRELVEQIDMKAYGEPQIVWFGTGNKGGYTLIQLIETSNISCHYCEEDSAMFLDVFSCKPFSIDVVKDCVQKYFKPMKMISHYLERSIPTL